MLHAPMDNVTSSMDDVTRSNGQRNDAPIDITRSNGQCNAMCEQIRFTRSNGQFLLLFLFLLLRSKEEVSLYASFQSLSK